MAESYSRRVVYTRVEETVYFRSSRCTSATPAVLQRARRPTHSDEPKGPKVCPSVAHTDTTPPCTRAEEHVTIGPKPATPARDFGAPSLPCSTADTSIPEKDQPLTVSLNPTAPAASGLQTMAHCNSDSACKQGCVMALASCKVTRFQTLIINAAALSAASLGVSADRNPKGGRASLVSNMSPGVLLSVLEPIAQSSEIHDKIEGYPPPACAHGSKLILTEASETCTKYIVSVVPDSTDGVVFSFSPVSEPRNVGILKPSGSLGTSRPRVTVLQPVLPLTPIRENAPRIKFSEPPVSTAMVVRSAGTLQVKSAPLSSLKFT